MRPSRCPRGAGLWSWAGSSSGPGPLRTAAPARLSRWWPWSWDRACDGDGDQGDEEPGPVASSTGDATVRDAGEACRVFRSVVSVLLRALGDVSLHPQGRPCGRPPAAAVLGRQPLLRLLGLAGIPD